jgi:hypothetical protein
VTRLQQLEDENRKLKQMVAELSLDDDLALEVFAARWLAAAGA